MPSRGWPGGQNGCKKFKLAKKVFEVPAGWLPKPAAKGTGQAEHTGSEQNE